MDYEGFDWHRPRYAGVVQQRLAVLDEIRSRPGHYLPALRAHYKQNPADFINDWGVTYDPRNADIGLPTYLPFILFPKQREFVEYVMRKWKAREPGLVEKSRDVGATWLAASLACTLCLFYEGMAVGFGSRVVDLVDKIGTMKPILPKARIFMANLPPEFRPGWDPAVHAPYMRIVFPETGSFIGGEGGDQIGRGDRTSIYFVDEAQPLDALVVTPHGYRPMADICVGSVVSGLDGRPQKVINVNDCGVHDVFRIGFSDGTSTECSPNHLWTVKKVWGGRATLTLRTHELANSYVYGSPGGQTQYRYRVPSCAPVQFAETAISLPLDPYLVGALLGDGSVKGGTVRITSADAEIVETFRRLLPVGVIIGAFDGKYTYNVVDELGRQGARVRSRARVAVATAGIAGFNGPDKFVPDAYRLSSPENRLSVLQGLLDTDGSATGGSASFYSSSLRLAQDVRFIVQSLGGTATLNRKPDRRGYRDIYDVHVMLPEGMPPFRLKRKLDKLQARKHPPDRAITSISHIGQRPVRCITVESSDGLYLTDNFIVTHNSAHIERPDLVEASLSETTRCRIDMSSVNTMNNPFARKRWEGRVEPFIFDWRDDPRKDEEWYEKRCRELDPVVVAQEIDRDYSAAVHGIVVPGAWVRAAIDACDKLGITPTGRRSASLDVADEGRDKNAIIGRTGIQIDHIEEWSGKGGDIYSTTQHAFGQCDLLGIKRMRYDADGLGAGVRGDARIINEERERQARHLRVEFEAFRGSGEVSDPDGLVDPDNRANDPQARTNKDFFANRKAQGWWSLRRRFERTFRWVTQGVQCAPDDIISISSKAPGYLKLVAELSQPTYKTNGVGKIVVDKSPDGTKSPNLGDACMIDWAPTGVEPMVIPTGLVAAIRAQRPSMRHMR